MRGALITIPKLSNVIEIPTDKERKLILFNEDALTNDKVKQFVEENKLEHNETDLEIGFDNLNSHDALKIALPENITVPSGFETVGHVIHLNLDEAQFPY